MDFARLPRLSGGARLHGGRFGRDHLEASPEHPAADGRNRAPFPSEENMSDVAIVGAGAWGTALAIVAARGGTHHVRLWAHEPEVCESIQSRHVNELFLAGQTIPGGVEVTNDLAQVVRGAKLVVSVMPSNHCRRLFQALKPHLKPEM